MDSDDVSLPTRFEEQLRYFQVNPEIDIVGGNITEFIGEENNIIGQRLVPVSNEAIREYMKERCAMNHVSVMYKKQQYKMQEDIRIGFGMKIIICGFVCG